MIVHNIFGHNQKWGRVRAVWTDRVRLKWVRKKDTLKSATTILDNAISKKNKIKTPKCVPIPVMKQKPFLKVVCGRWMVPYLACWCRM